MNGRFEARAHLAPEATAQVAERTIFVAFPFRLGYKVGTIYIERKTTPCD